MDKELREFQRTLKDGGFGSSTLRVLEKDTSKRR